ncbi:porin family protein [Enterovibrio calviensis]|uniref:porin family protein n=1 Tax=Enterovibrio calviensis TaxID=91359 RepID=UPI00048429D1|nr:porin family protein [Enterovibrio calviensis]
MRKKIHFAAIALAFTSTSSFAATPFNNDALYLGFDIGFLNTDSELISDLGNSQMDSTLGGLGGAIDDSIYNDLKLGYKFNDNLRAYAFWRVTSEDSAQTRVLSSNQVQLGTVDIKRQETIGGLGLDYMLPINDRMYWVVGGSLGRYSSEVEMESKSMFGFADKTNIESSGLAVGLNTSIGYALNENWAFESGVNYMRLNGNSTKFENSGADLEYKNENQFGFFAGVNYTF